MKNKILDYMEPLLIAASVVWLFLAIKIGTYQFDVESELSDLPSFCTEELQGWTIEQATSKEMKSAHEDSSGSYASAMFVGLTFVGEKKIWLSTIDYEAHKAFPHEIGHVCDSNNDFPSKSEEFEEIFEAEASGYGATNPQEFFAETYGKLVSGHPDKDTPLANEFVARYEDAE